LPSHGGHVPLDGAHTTGEDEGDILVGEQRSLFNGLFGDAQQFLAPEASQATLVIGIDIDFRIMDGEPDGDFPAQVHLFSCRFTVIDGQVVNLSRLKGDIGMFKEVALDLVEIGLG